MAPAKIIIVFSFVPLFFAGCKKSDTKVEPETDVFSFTYNGQNYSYSVTNNIANAGVGKGLDGTPFIDIDMINVFGGRIHFEKTGCAYLEPLSTTVHLDPGCILSEIDPIGNPVSIDSVAVYTYQSGSLNVSFSNCVTKTGVDFTTGLNYQYNDCAAIGNFDLTLVNKNNVTIRITNGIVKFHHVIIR